MTLISAERTLDWVHFIRTYILRTACHQRYNFTVWDRSFATKFHKLVQFIVSYLILLYYLRSLFSMKHNDNSLHSCFSLLPLWPDCAYTRSLHKARIHMTSTKEKKKKKNNNTQNTYQGIIENETKCL